MLPEHFYFRIRLLNSEKARTITVVDLCNTNNQIVGSGHAICSPQDEFNAQRGILIAEGRALKAWHQSIKRLEKLGYGNPIINSNDG